MTRRLSILRRMRGRNIHRNDDGESATSVLSHRSCDIGLACGIGLDGADRHSPEIFAGMRDWRRRLGRRIKAANVVGNGSRARQAVLKVAKFAR